MRVVLSSLLVLITLAGSAQSDLEIVRNLRKRDGLTSDNINCMVRDPHGFLWIGTGGGLNRFDGVSFRNYFFNADDPAGLSNDVIYDLQLTRTGLLLIATGDGISVINTATGRFENDLIEHPEVQAGCGHKIQSFFEDPDGQVWVNHLGVFDILSTDLRFLYRFSDLSWAAGLKGVDVAFEEWQMDGQGRLWIPSDSSGLQVVDFRARAVYNRKHNPWKWQFLDLDYRAIRSFLLDEDSGRLWLGPWGQGLLGFDLHSGEKKSEPLAGSPIGDEEGSVNLIVRKANGQLLFSFRGILYVFDPLSGRLETILNFDSPNHPAAGSSFFLSSACIIDRDHIFLGDFTRGLLDLRTSPVKVRQDLGAVLGSERLRRVLELPGIGLFALTAKGAVFELEPGNFSIRKAIHVNRRRTNLQEAASDGRRIWLAGLDRFTLFDAFDRSFLPVPTALDTFRGWLVSALHCDDRQGLWIATREPATLWRLDIPTSRLDRIADADIRPLISHGHQSRIDQIEQDEQGILWFSSMTADVIVALDPRSGQWTLHPRGASVHRILQGGGVQSMKPLAGKIWLTTSSRNGLLAYDPGTDGFDIFSGHYGIPSGQLWIIPSRIDQNVYLVSESSMVVFDTRKQIILGHWPIGPDHGLDWPIWRRTRVTSMGPIVLNDHVVGVLKLPNGSRDSLFPKVILDAMAVNNRSIPFDTRTDPLQFSSLDRNMTLSFVLPDLDGSIPWQLSYRLLGLDTAWTLAGNQRQVTYNHLRPGRYSFEVRTMNPHLNQSDISRLVSFRIVPPLWRRPWFVALAIGLFASVFTWTARLRIRSIRRSASIKVEMTELEMKALQAQMNPHFIFNCLNSIDALIHTNEKHLATQFLNKFARLLRSVLDSSRHNVVPIAKDIETLRLYVELEQFRHDNRFDVTWEIDPKLLRGDFQVPPLVVQPFVENAILHGLGPRQKPGGMLRIGLSLAGDVVRYMIEDNGVGRSLQQDEVSPGRESHGIRMTLDRIRLFNREEEPSVTITDLVEDGHPAGTRVEVILHLR